MHRLVPDVFAAFVILQVVLVAIDSSFLNLAYGATLLRGSKGKQRYSSWTFTKWLTLAIMPRICGVSLCSTLW